MRKGCWALWWLWLWFCCVWASVVEGDGADASPRRNFDKAPKMGGGGGGENRADNEKFLQKEEAGRREEKR